MKIFLIANIFPPVVGGSATVYQNLCRQLGTEAVVLAPSHDCYTGMEYEGWRESDAQLPCEVHRIEFLRPRVRYGTGGAFSSLRQWAMEDGPLLWRIRHDVLRLLEAISPDAVCFGETLPFYWFHDAVKRRGVPVVQYVHGEEVTCTPLLRLYGRGQWKAVSRCEAVVAVSRYTKGLLLERGVDPGRISVITNGVDLDRFQPGPKDRELINSHRLEGKRVLLSLGRVEQRKGFDTVVRALPKVLQHFPDVVYLIVGEGSYSSELKRLVREAGLEKSVIFTGFTASGSLVKYYRTCDLFLMPNRQLPNGDTEGFGVVFLEAAACARPVIGGIAGGVSDAVEHGKTGLLVDGASPEATADAIIRILSDPDLAERYGAAGLCKARESSWAKKALLFREVCQNAKARLSPKFQK